MIANSIQKSTGCGCGGSSSAPLAPCSCGGAGCAACQAQGLVRPRFFAGQLLTEDDLQLLTDYVGQKNRLHNRFLFGAGVVCGLEVTCHPCGDGQVIVHPGYALDCCGNDLVLACAKTLDINAMVRDLRRDQLGGFDCVDPCPPPHTECKDQSTNTSQKHDVSEQPGTETKQPKVPARKYCLYLRYCEQPSDPVMPYSTGDDCGRLVCEPTRVHEGIRFELRCPPTGDASNPLLKRLCECLGDLRMVPDLFYAAYKLHQYSASIGEALKSINDRTPLPVSTADLEIGSKGLEDEMEKLGLHYRTPLSNTATAGTSVPPKGPLDIPQSYRDAAFKLAHLVARVQLLEPRSAELETLTKHARELLWKTNIDVNHAFGKLPPTPENVELVAALEIINEPRVDDVAIQFLARRAIFYPTTVKFYESLAERVRDWLLERLDQSPFLTDCTLRQQAKKVELPEIKQHLSTSDARSFANTHGLAGLVINYVRDCVCRALNPACGPCDDSAVLLACLEVEECNVVKICNLERTFVLSPVAVRYWLPPLQLIGNVLGDLCCMPLEGLITDDPDKTMNSFSKKLVSSEVFRLLRASLCVKNDKEAWELVKAFSQLFDSSRSPLGSKSFADLLSSPSAESAAQVEQARDVGMSSEPMDAMLAQLDARIEEMTEKKVQEILARETRMAAPTERRAPRRGRKKPPEPESDPSGGGQ